MPDRELKLIKSFDSIGLSNIEKGTRNTDMILFIQ